MLRDMHNFFTSLYCKTYDLSRSLNPIQRHMDKSWMSAPRGTTRYNDGCRAFVAFSISNCTAVDGKIYCPCKYCRNNQRHTPDYVLAHLIGGRGMNPGYNLWYMHGETTTGSAIPGQCSSYHSGTVPMRRTLRCWVPISWPPVAPRIWIQMMISSLHQPEGLARRLRATQRPST